MPIRKRLHSLIAQSGLAQVVAEASSVEAAIVELERLAPDAVVLDLQLADGSGCAVLEAIKFIEPNCCVVVLTNFALPEMRARCIQLGADHVLEKSCDFERVPDLIGRARRRQVSTHLPQVARPPPARLAAVAAVAGVSAGQLPELADPAHHFRHLVDSIDVDITPLRQAEANRQQAQLLAQATLDSLSGHLCVLDSEGTILATNLAWRNFGHANGCVPAAVNEGANYLAVCEAGVRDESPGASEMATGLRAVLLGRLPSFDAEYACHSPRKQRWFAARVTPLLGSQPLRVVLSHSEISGHKQAELALRESEQRWKFAIEGSGDGVWDRDLVMGRNSYSRRWKQMLGYDEHEIGDSLQEWSLRVHPDDLGRVRALAEACLQGTIESFSCELRMRCKDGSWKWVLDRGAVVDRDADGAPRRMIGTQSDIDERKKAEATRAMLEAQLWQAQQLEVMGTLASSMAHDFNNIMGAVLGNVSLALQDVDAGHVAYGHLEQIRKAGLRARQLVQGILATNRHGPEKTRSQWLNALVEEEIALLRATLPDGVSIDARLCTEALSACVEPSQLSQVLLNLGTNAWQALLGQPGSVQIGLARADPMGDSGQGDPAMRVASHAHLWVRDTGQGMDQATQARIFEPLFTTKIHIQGTGLGLSTVQRIVLALGGSIEVESTPGLGSCFHVFLPLAPAPEQSELVALDDLPADLAPSADGHVMYIDDDETMSVLVSALLPREGLRVCCFKDAKLALATLRAAPDRFDLVVTDFNMSGQSGLIVAREVALIRPDLPVVLASGHITDRLANDARAEGIRALVQKERLFEDLTDEIRRVLSEARARL